MTKLLTVDEVAEILRRTPGQIRWMRNQGTGPKSARIAGRVFFRQEDVDEYLERSFADGQSPTLSA
ncbi:helix-turn-helix domain-containing protein [Plantibacter sp. CFBP 8804]|uniref:helix-turn-helix domain-containing protein n=1 Tax=Plantibacter sp. CFBP 8804 TaxID=2775270 RepID=UPI0017834E5C|nr:helix-turn-helix domain-containing protein [Plantibacter sp. CFBP 8804]MBD8517081.1 helix-turn-helix domain-containing protein [Plantibacter sp. CFBP 8804]